MEIIHTVNSGLYFRIGEQAIFFDGLHGGKKYGFSDTPEIVLQQMEAEGGAFACQTALVFTHCHADHYDKKLVERFMERHPGTRLISPAHGEKPEALRLGDFVLHAVPTIHQGRQEMQIEHYCYVLEAEGKNYVLCGDALLSEDIVREIRRIAAGHIHAVFLNIYHLFSEKEQRLIRQLEPLNCCIIHFPFPEDDVRNYRSLAADAESIGGIGRVRRLRPMESINFI